MRKIILTVIAVILIAPCTALCDTGDSSKNLKLIKLTEDATAEDSYRPIAGKEKLLAVKVVDDEGKGVYGAEVKFEIISGNGELISNTTSQVSQVSITEKSTPNGTIGIIIIADEQLQIINKVKASLLSDNSQNVEFTFQTIGLPKQLEKRNLLLEAWQNDRKLHENCIEEWETESDAFWTTGTEWQKKGNKNIQRIRRTRKGDNVKTETIYPVVKVTGRKRSGVPKPVTAPDLEKIAYNSIRNECVLVHRNSPKEKLSDFELTYIDCEKMVIVREERIKIKGTIIFKRYITEYLSWEKYPEIRNIWGTMKQTEKTYADYDKLTDTTVRTYTKREVNKKIQDSEFNNIGDK